jgi:cytochrome c oxidase subunit 2
VSARVGVLAAVLAAGALAAAGCSRPGKAGAAAGGDVIHISAKKFAFEPNKITLKRGKPATLELTSLDRKHGFLIPDLKLRADVPAGGSVRVTLTPDKTGTFPFRCDLFCGSGHDSMVGVIEVVD